MIAIKGWIGAKERKKFMLLLAIGLGVALILYWHKRRRSE